MISSENRLPISESALAGFDEEPALEHAARQAQRRRPENLIERCGESSLVGVEYRSTVNPNQHAPAGGERLRDGGLIEADAPRERLRRESQFALEGEDRGR